jgi:hypothetical protein
MSDELFELSLSGGQGERIYRRARPEVLRLPWGRPLGVQVTAEERIEARRHWTVAALQEYRSAFAQAAVLQALVAARVPLDLSAIASRFPIDELAHAEICARVANELGGGAPVSFDPRKVMPFVAPVRRNQRLEAVVQVARLFGAGEGWSFGYLEGLRRHTRVPLLRAVWGALVRDEATHARFAWTFLAWARDELDDAEWGEVELAARADVEAIVAGWRAVKAFVPAAFSVISPLGAGDRDAYIERAKLALHKRVVEPFAKVGIDVANATR